MLDIPRTLQFEPVRDGVGAGAPAGEDSWEQWAAGRERRPVHLTVYSGPSLGPASSRTRVGGVFVAPAREVLGLRLWNDADEGVVELDGTDDPVPYVVYDLEKIVRMMLHQSGLALEILASPCLLDRGALDARGIVEAAITGEVVDHYLEVAEGVLERYRDGETDQAGLRDGVRHALTGLALTDGRVILDFEALTTWWGDQISASLEVEGAADELADRLQRLLERLSTRDRGALPESPRHYDALNDYLVEARLQGPGDAGGEAA